MMRLPFLNLRTSLGLVLPLFLAAGLCRTLDGAAVSGRVIDQDGKPVAGATVTLSPVDQSGVFPSTQNLPAEFIPKRPWGALCWAAGPAPATPSVDAGIDLAIAFQT